MEIPSSNNHESPRTASNLIKPEPSEKLCRICFDKDTIENPTISPCECSGSMKFIHEECLKKWILSKTRDPQKFCCDVCKSKIAMEIHHNLVLSCKGLKEEIFKILIFPIIILMVSTIVGLIFAYLVTSSDNPKATTSVKIYLSLVLFACLTIDVALITMVVKAFRYGCCQLNVISWKIYTSSNHENLNVTNLTEIIEKPQALVTVEKAPGNEIEAFEKIDSSNGVAFDNNKDGQTFTKLRDRIESRVTDDGPKSPTFCKEDESGFNS